MKEFAIAAFYKFAPVEDYESLKAPLLQLMNDNEIKGTVILASEGINGTICGDENTVAVFFSWLKHSLNLNDIPHNITFDDQIPFDKAKVKLRSEIVSMGVDGINPAQQTGNHVAPEKWNELLMDPEVEVIDTRNEYEVSLGTFQNASNPDTLNFRDFPEYVQKNLQDKKNKKIAMFCTGGIRCEKSTAYLLNQGFSEVYQLDGGILNYLQTVPQEDSLWQGNCFVFDDRIALDAQLKKLEKGIVDSEWKHKNRNRGQ